MSRQQDAKDRSCIFRLMIMMLYDHSKGDEAQGNFDKCPGVECTMYQHWNNGRCGLTQ